MPGPGDHAPTQTDPDPTATRETWGTPWQTSHALRVGHGGLQAPDGRTVRGAAREGLGAGVARRLASC